MLQYFKDLLAEGGEIHFWGHGISTTEKISGLMWLIFLVVASIGLLTMPPGIQLAQNLMWTMLASILMTWFSVSTVVSLRFILEDFSIADSDEYEHVVGPIQRSTDLLVIIAIAAFGFIGITPVFIFMRVVFVVALAIAALRLYTYKMGPPDSWVVLCICLIGWVLLKYNCAPGSTLIMIGTGCLLTILFTSLVLKKQRGWALFISIGIIASQYSILSILAQG